MDPHTEQEANTSEDSIAGFLVFFLQSGDQLIVMELNQPGRKSSDSIIDLVCLTSKWSSDDDLVCLLSLSLTGIHKNNLALLQIWKMED